MNVYTVAINLKFGLLVVRMKGYLHLAVTVSAIQTVWVKRHT